MRVAFRIFTTPRNRMTTTELYNLLNPAVFIEVRAKTKKPVRVGWQNLTLDAMARDYLEALAGKVDKGHASLGVALGYAGVHSIDIDVPSRIMEFEGANPWSRDTFTSRGRPERAQYFFRLADAPELRTKFLKYCDGKVGEARGLGGQSVLLGEHEVTHRPYTNNGKSLATISLSQIIWPSGWRGGWMSETQTTPPPETAPQTQAFTPAHPPNVQKAGIEPPTEIYIDQNLCWVDAFVPTSSGSNHLLQFELARECKAHNADPRAIHRLWYSKAKPFTRQQLTEDDYWVEFGTAYQRVSPAGGMEQAWAESEAVTAPGVDSLRDPRSRRLAAFCWLLQQHHPGKPFFLACRKLGELLGSDHMTAARRLKTFCALGILRLEKRGTLEDRRASYYTYLK